MTHDNTNTQTFRKTSTYAMVVTALMAAVTCILAPLSVPIGPVPISLTNFAIYLSLYLLGWKRGTVSYLVYVLIGMVGVPVFSGFTGGMGRLLGPTGGYIVGFIPMALIAGAVIDRFRNRGIQLAGMIAGTAVCYAFGTVWFLVVYAKNTGAIGLWTALGWCVFPYILPDCLKIALALAIRKRLAAAIRLR